MVNKSILTGRLVQNDHSPARHKQAEGHSGILSRAELRKVIKEMLG